MSARRWATSSSKARSASLTRRASLDGAPAHHALHGDADDRPGREVVRGVLRVALAERGDRRGVLHALVRLGLEQLAGAVQAQPGEARPVLVPAIDDEAQLRAAQQVAHAWHVVRVVAP